MVAGKCTCAEKFTLPGTGVTYSRRELMLFKADSIPFIFAGKGGAYLTAHRESMFTTTCSALGISIDALGKAVDKKQKFSPEDFVSEARRGRPFCMDEGCVGA